MRLDTVLSFAVYAQMPVFKVKIIGKEQIIFFFNSEWLLSFVISASVKIYGAQFRFWSFSLTLIGILVLTGDEVFYIDCTNVPLEHLELVVREVYLPLMCTNQSVMTNTGGDKVMDVLHRLMSAVEITQGHVEVCS